ncbi:MAG: serine--tRNA ligase, partial [Candidatus Micrarchaeota archaeon]|nr:serine--tRNA ligase [Candidatus Micrarchaeota archaeon]
MLELRYVRENPDAVRENLSRRGNSVLLKALDDLLAADGAQRKALVALEQLRGRRNTISKDIHAAKKAGKDFAALLAEAKDLP